MPINIQDLLGGLADAFLIQSGNKPMYQDIRSKRELGNIDLDFENDPMGTINRIHKVDPKLAEQYYQNQGMRDYRKSMAEAAGQRADTASDKANLIATSKIRQQAASMLMASRGDPKAFDNAKAQAKKLAERFQVDISDIDLLDPADHRGILEWSFGNGMTAKDQVGAAATDRKAVETERRNRVLEGIGQQNADSNAVRAGASASQAGTAAERGRVYAESNTDPQTGKTITVVDPRRGRGSGNAISGGGSGSGPAPKKEFKYIQGPKPNTLVLNPRWKG